MELVARPDLESLLATLASNLEDPRAGLFGPRSLTWKINRESALFLGAGRAALLQLAHPWVAAAIAEHSTVLHRPVARFHNTFRIVYTMIFGSVPQAFAAARFLHSLHTRIGGKLPESVGSWPGNTRYEANELPALRWVWSTLIETAVLAYETVLPLTPEERAQYYQETKTFAALFGIPASALPSDWSAFVAWNQEMAASDILAVDASARSMGHAILAGAGSWIHPPAWCRALTAAWMPPRLRDQFGLPLSFADQRRLDRARRWLPRLYSKLPLALRFVGPYQEARLRLRNRNPGYFTQRSNRFWIGQSYIPFSR